MIPIAEFLPEVSRLEDTLYDISTGEHFTDVWGRLREEGPQR